MELVSRLSDSSSRSNSRGDSSRRRSSGGVAIDLGLGAVPGDVTGLAAAVAGLAGSVEWAAVGCSAVTGDVTYQG